MKNRIFMFMIFASVAVAQVSPPSTQSRVAGRFVAYNYGAWSLPVYTMPSGIGSQTFTLSNSTAVLQDRRAIMPFAVNAPLRVGIETVTVTAVGAGCIINSTAIGACSITATFTLPHTVADFVGSGTWGLQEALNDAAASGGGTVTVDSAWIALGGTSAMISAATIPSLTGVENEISGPLTPTFSTVTSPKYIGSSTSFSCTVGPASESTGTDATCVCAANHTCTTSSGDLTLHTGAATTTGVAFTVVLYGSAQSPYPNCSEEVHTAAAQSTVGYTLETSTGFQRYSFGAPAASTVYTIHYQCGY